VRSCVGNLKGGAWLASASRGFGMSTESDFAVMLDTGSTVVADMLGGEKVDDYLLLRSVSQQRVMCVRAAENKEKTS